MLLNRRIAGNSSRYGICKSFTQTPISGRLMITKRTLPTHMLAISPQNSCGF